MQMTFKGMAIAQKQYTSKAGNQGNSITFLDIDSGKQFQVTSPLAIDASQVYKVVSWVLDGVLGLGKTGLYFRADKITGAVK